MNIFIGTAGKVRAITVKLDSEYHQFYSANGSSSKLDLMRHSDFAYAFDKSKGMWVWIKCRYASVRDYEYFSERDIQEIISYYTGCPVQELRRVISLKNAEHAEHLVSEFKQLQREQYDERF